MVSIIILATKKSNVYLFCANYYNDTDSKMKSVMNSSNEQASINLQTLEETAPQMTDAFPFRSACTDLREYPGHEYPWHWHNEVEILMILSGKLRFLTSSKALELETGDILFLPGGMLHSTQTCGDLPAIHNEYIFSPLLISGMPGSEIDRKYVSAVLQADIGPVLLRAGTEKNALAALHLKKAYNCYISETDGYELQIRHCMDEVWMILRSEIVLTCAEEHYDRIGEERIKTILQYLQNSYQSVLSVADMAAIAHISERECSRCFKRHLGITPMEYLLDIRLNNACALLENTTLSIGEIASDCGFSSASYFSKQFKAKYRITPRAYRTRTV